MTDDIQQYRKILEDSELSITADLEFIAKYITLYPVYDDTGIEVLFKVPINDVVTIDGHIGIDDEPVKLTARVTTLQMSVSVPMDVDEDPYHGELILQYNFQPQFSANSDDEEAYEEVKNWFDEGNYDSELVEKLTDIGFSESAASDIEIDYSNNDQIDYYAGGIAREIADAVRFVLNQDANAILSKFGPAVLTTDVEFSANDILPHKHTIIKFLLAELKHKGPQSETVVNIANKLRTLNINWPELDTIEQSMNAGKLTESLKLSDLNTASEKRQLTAVKKDGSRIQYISNPSLAIQLAAVQQSGWAIRSIDNPTPAVQLAAVQHRPWAIEYIKNPSLASQSAAVQEDGLNIKYIKNPSPALFADHKVKRSIIKTVLNWMHTSQFDLAKEVVDYLRKHNVDWPELDTIEQSIGSGS